MTIEVTWRAAEKWSRKNWPAEQWSEPRPSYTLSDRWSMAAVKFLRRHDIAISRRSVQRELDDSDGYLDELRGRSSHALREPPWTVSTATERDL